MRAMYRIIASHPNPEKVALGALDTGYEYLIGVPDIIWQKYVRLVGENVVEKRVFEGNNPSSIFICCSTFLVDLSTSSHICVRK